MSLSSYHRAFLVAILAIVCTTDASPWSKKGHQVVASIAQRHLSSEAYYTIRDILDGDNLVYWSAWLDSVRDDEEFAYTSTWHYINVDAGYDYDDRYDNPAGDAVTAIYDMVDILQDPLSTKEDQALALKVLTHIMGDLHQPLHCGHKSDSGGNSIYIYYNDQRTSLHSFWDYTIVEDAHDWGYYDWSKNIDNISVNEEWAITAGSIDDWARSNVEVAADVYRYFPRNKRVTTEDVTYWTPTIEQQMLRGGLRLASLLNTAFSPVQVGIQKVDAADSEMVDVYTLTGVCVRRDVKRDEARRDLPAGIYIIGTRKVVVK